MNSSNPRSERYLFSRAELDALNDIASQALDMAQIIKFVISRDAMGCEMSSKLLPCMVAVCDMLEERLKGLDERTTWLNLESFAGEKA